MKGSLIIVGFFVLGVFSGIGNFIPNDFFPEEISQYVLYVLMFLVGLSIGYDRELLLSLRQTNWKILLVPMGTIVGTLVGTAVVGAFIPQWSISESMAVGSGFGYYSLSSIFITKYKGAALGTIALMSNIMREVFALLATPLLVRWFGRLAPISAAGATSMDTTLPIITQYSGRDYVVIAISHGIIVDLTVPFLVTFFCSL
ncbi:Membrane protein of unknown function [Sphingobacterium nematocida]|uniref:Lysine exporter LysO family protein n=1 Tax=Sphingobacterium nematocida TaxID=1513896 RepID=A0A1T5F485_9SPHI|nr:lysine exporter LysO family protein [Sphingobacterium nematocida]SKB90860.1 Membrane protein of unknown function [Sphingobacterium nematocida]